MLNFFLSLFAYGSVNKKEDVIIPNDIEISDKSDVSCYDEECDSFCNEFNDYQPINKPMRKTSSLSVLPKDKETRITIEYNPNHIYPDKCSNCQAKIYKKYNPTYHAYDRLWCFKCWKSLEININ